MLSTEQIKRLIAQGENSRIEFKSCTDVVSSSVYETVCSFLNKDGGQILLGIKDDGEVVGINKKKCGGNDKEHHQLAEQPTTV